MIALQSCFYLCDNYRKLEPNFANITASMIEKFRKSQASTFAILREKKVVALSMLRYVLISPLSCHVYTFALTLALRYRYLPRAHEVHVPKETTVPVCQACLMLLLFGEWRDKGYGTTQRERTAKVWPTVLLRSCLKELCSKVQTKSVFLIRIGSLSDSCSRLACWQLWLPEFDFDVVNRAGTPHQIRNTLFELLADSWDNRSLEHEHFILEIQTLTNWDTGICFKIALETKTISLQVIDFSLGILYWTKNTSALPRLVKLFTRKIEMHCVALKS